MDAEMRKNMQVESSKLISQKKPVLKTLLNKLLEIYPYASILMSDCIGKTYQISKQGTNISEDSYLSELGYVIKVFDKESYGEYACNQISDDTIDDIISAVKDSLMPLKDKLPEGLSVKSYPLLSSEKLCFEKSTEYEMNPSDLGDEAIINKLASLREKAITSSESVFDCISRFQYLEYHKMFLAPDKEMIQNVMTSSAILLPLGLRGEEVKNSMSCASCLGGAEALDQLESKIPAAIESLELLLKSEPMVPGEYDCICAPDLTGMIVHEAFGHGVEMDMFVKDRALAQQYIGEYVASPLVTMHDGACAAKENATYFFDDEGTLAHDTVIIEKGILKQGICDAQAGLALQTAPTGNGRRQTTEHKAYTRMTNTFFEPGTDKLEDMIASIDYGFYLQNASSGMEDPKNWGIQCMTSLAREIKDGKFTGKAFSPVILTGYVPDLLKSISMMSDGTELAGCGMCGKGHKEWVKVSDGGPHIKARIRLG